MPRKKLKSFLLEIGTEELPPKQIDGLAAALAGGLEKHLKDFSLTYGFATPFSSPRRLAVLISDLIEKQPDQPMEIRGPSIDIAFDASGQPTVAAEKFAKTCGVAVSQLERIQDKKGVALFYKSIRPGKNTIELLPEIILGVIKKLSFNRSMRWGENQGPFVRPVHWVVAMFGHDIIPIELFGIKASNKTFGHRFCSPKPIIIYDPNKYEKVLAEKGWVIASAEKRKQKIRQQIMTVTDDDAALVFDDLLTETTNLTEWPVALVGTFHERFLKIPQEVLITTLKHHQRSFPIADEAGELLPRFVIITNIESKLPNQVIAGNERVVQARFTDAEYFYHHDLKNVFVNNLERLKTLAFQASLGSLYDKTLRLKTVTSFIATKIGAAIADSIRAAELAKCDLVTSMVWEFPELQGVMGYYYARVHENQSVAIAIKEHYLPRFAKDQLPKTNIGCALALADRLDTLVGFFGINKIPSGEKDPFGLRRAASGILRIILEKNLTLDLKEAIEQSCATYKNTVKNPGEIVAKVMDFMYERLRFIYAEQNKNPSVFRTVLACMPTNLHDFTRRFAAVDSFVQQPEVSDLIEIYKRIRNILDKTTLPKKNRFQSSLASETAERSLGLLVEKKTKIIAGFYQDKQYYDVLVELIKLKAPLNDFFDNVMVLVNDERVRNNRLALLKSIQDLFLLIADLSYIVYGK